MPFKKFTVVEYLIEFSANCICSTASSTVFPSNDVIRGSLYEASLTDLPEFCTIWLECDVIIGPFLSSFLISSSKLISLAL